MAKSLTKIWLGGLKRLISIQAQHARDVKRNAARPVRPTGKPVRQAEAGQTGGHRPFARQT
jgi:hypothetical protein